MKLIETLMSRPIINEAEQKDLPEGILAKGKWLTCNIDTLNHNNRVYGADVWEKVMEDEELCEKMASRTFYGQGEHPAETQSDLMLTSHIVTGMTVCAGLDESNKGNQAVYSDVEVLDTPAGRIVNTMIKAGCMVGVSTRAEGDLEEAENDDFGKHQRVVKDAYNYKALDFTADPSTLGTVPQEMQHALVHEIREGVRYKKISERLPKWYVKGLLESLGTDESVALLKEFMGEKECEDNPGFLCAHCHKCSDRPQSCESLINQELIKMGSEAVIRLEEGTAKGKVVGLTESLVTIRLEDGTEIDTETAVLTGDSIEVRMPEGQDMGMLDDELDGLGGDLEAEMDAQPGLQMGEELHDDEPLPGEKIEAESALDSVKGDDDEELEDEEEEFEEDGVTPKKKKSPFEGRVFESYDQMVDFLSIAYKKMAPKEQKHLAQRMRTNVLNEKVTATQTVKEIRRLKISEASRKAQLDEAIVLLDVAENKLAEIGSNPALELKILTKKLTEARSSDKTAEVDGLCRILSERTQGLKTLHEQITHVQKKHADEVEALKENIASAKGNANLILEQYKSRVRIKFNKKLVEAYVGLKLDLSGLKVHQSSQTLLENCETTAEVNSVFDTIKEGMRRDTLRPGKITEVRVSKSTEDPETKQVNESVGRAFESMNG